MWLLELPGETSDCAKSSRAVKGTSKRNHPLRNALLSELCLLGGLLLGRITSFYDFTTNYHYLDPVGRELELPQKTPAMPAKPAGTKHQALELG